MEKVILTRLQLYEWVWQQPVQKLAISLRFNAIKPAYVSGSENSLAGLVRAKSFLVHSGLLGSAVMPALI